MRFRPFIYLILVFFAIDIASAQSIKIENAPMSSGDRKKVFYSIGNSDLGYLALLDQKGQVWLYDGYELQPWNSVPIKNPFYIESLFVKDSSLYAITSDALLYFSANTEGPTILNKSTNHYFSQAKQQIYYVADLNSYTLNQKQILGQVQASLPMQKSDYVVDQHDEVFYIFKNDLIWADRNERILFKKSEPTVKQIVVDSWNAKWILDDGKLKKLDIIRYESNSEILQYKGQKQALIKTFDGSTFGLYGADIVRVGVENMNTLCSFVDGNVKDFWIDEVQGVWILDDRNLLHHYSAGKWYSWSKVDVNIEDDIIGFSSDGDIISLILSNDGILQSRRKSSVEDWIWVPHRLNSKLKNLSILAFAKRKTSNGQSKLFLFTENYGIYTLDRKEIGTLREGIPGYGIMDVRIDGDQAILLDKGKRWYSFSFGRAERKSLQKIADDSLPPEITSDQFIIDDGQIMYLAGKNIVQLNVQSGQSNEYSYPYKFTKACKIGGAIVDYSESRIGTYVVPSKFSETIRPRLLEVELLTIHDEKFMIWPEETLGRALLMSEYPVVLSAKASYVPSPKSIEYSWKTMNSSSLSADYKFRNSTRWKIDADGAKKIQLSVKLGEVEEVFELDTILVEKDIVKEDNSWAIYLSAILAGLIALILIIFRFRSKRQKRKINALLVEKRALELEQKALQLQMNPHFIFNALNGVKGMIALGEDKKARQYLTKTSSWIRNMLNDARAEKIEIGKEVKNLESYMEIERELQGNKWDFSVDIDDEIVNTWKIAPMMIQPFIENAIIHAFKGIDYQGKILLRLVKRGPNVSVLIDDNGVGLQAKLSGNHQSVALKVIRDRLKLMHDGTSQAKFTLINKGDTDSEKSGVTVEFQLPILD